jgi:ketosteroid isomerase-like protein
VSAEDNAAWANDFTEDGIFMIGNTPAVRGRAAIQKWGETRPNVTSLTFSDIQIDGRGDLAWATSAYSSTVEGMPEPDTGKQLVVLQRQADGSWRTVAASVSSDLPPSGNLATQAGDPQAGTWELNVARSKYSPGPPPRSQTRTYEVTGQQVRSVQKGIDAEGKPTLVQFTANYDGKDYPYSGSPDYDTVALTRVDNFTASFTQKRAGNGALTGTRVISQDGKAMTISGKGTNAKGQPTDIMLVFEKR